MTIQPINTTDYLIDYDYRKSALRDSFAIAAIKAAFVVIAALAVLAAFAAPLFAFDSMPFANKPNSSQSNPAHPFFNGQSQSARFYKESKKGWFYYETIKEEPLKQEIEENNETIKQTTIANLYPVIDNAPKARAAILEAEKRFIRSIPFDNLSSLSAEEFRQAYDKVRDVAAMRPDLENALAYMRLNKFSVDQANHFKDVMLIVSNDNEFIDPSLASSAYGSKLIREQEKQKLKSFFETNKTRLAITIFYGGLSHPSYDNQKGAVEAFQRDYPHTEVLWIDVSNSPETIEKMGLLTIPESWLAWQTNDEGVIWRRITSGVADYAALEKKPLFLYEKTIEKNEASER
jgi:conjugal transfer pilus assembly protein TraF